MMERSPIVTTALIAILIVTAGYGLTLPSSMRKGTISSVTIDPTEPTTNGPVTLHISTPDYLLLDHSDVKKIGNTFTVRIYWNEPAEGSTGAGPTSASIQLGTLVKGKYRVVIQSYCGRSLGGSAQVPFDVVDAGSSISIHTIDDVWVVPEAPTTSETLDLHVAGHWPTAGYSQYLALTRLSGTAVYVALYWTRPAEAAADVVTPYDFTTPLRLRLPGAYTIRVRVFLDEQQVDSAEITVNVVMGTGSDGGWPWDMPSLGLDI